MTEPLLTLGVHLHACIHNEFPPPDALHHSLRMQRAKPESGTQKLSFLFLTFILFLFFKDAFREYA
jgi:hypothetical protein